MTHFRMCAALLLQGLPVLRAPRNILILIATFQIQVRILVVAVLLYILHCLFILALIIRLELWTALACFQGHGQLNVPTQTERDLLKKEQSIKKERNNRATTWSPIGFGECGS